MINSIFTTAPIHGWITTLRHGQPVMRTSLRAALGIIATIVIGGLSRVVTEITAFDRRITEPCFVLARRYDALVGANARPALAALSYRYVKPSGRTLVGRHVARSR